MAAHPGYLRYRVVNFVTGAEVASDLPHLNKSTWEVRGYQAAAAGSNMLGSFTIPLLPPLSDNYHAAKFVYDQLDYGLRVEAYPGLPWDGSALGSHGGQPSFAGFITGIVKDFDKYELTGVNDLFVVDQSAAFPGELVSGQGSYSISNFFGNIQTSWSDDFSTWTAANYQHTTNWTGGTSAVPLSLPAVKNTAVAAEDYTFTTGYYSGSAAVGPSAKAYPLLAQGVVTITTATQVNGADCGTGGVVVSGSGTLNLSLRCSVRLKWNAANTNYDVDVLVSQRDNVGVDTTTTFTNQWTGVSSPFTAVIQVGVTADGVNQTATVNGQRLTPVVLPLPNITSSVAPGFYWNGSANAGAKTFTGANLTLSHYTQNTGNGSYIQSSPFKPTSFTASPFSADPKAVDMYGRTLLDLCVRGAAIDGYQLRYTPIAAASGSPFPQLGTFEYGPSVGTDLSAQIMFEGGTGSASDTLVSCPQEPNAEIFGSIVRMAGTSGADSGGTVEWVNIPALKTYGYLQGTAAITGFSSLSHLAQLGISVANKRGFTSASAKSAVVLRTADTADLWRELDRVTIHAPILGLNHVAAVILGYSFTEGSPTQTLLLDQYPLSDSHLVDRFKAGLRYLGNTFAAR